MSAKSECDICGDSVVSMYGDLTKCHFHTDMYEYAANGELFDLEHQRRRLNIICEQNISDVIKEPIRAFIATPNIGTLRDIIHNYRLYEGGYRYFVFDSMSRIIALLDISDDLKIEMLKPLSEHSCQVFIPLVYNYALMEKVLKQCKQPDAIQQMVYYALEFNLPALECLHNNGIEPYDHHIIREIIKKCRNEDYIRRLSSIEYYVKYFTAEQLEWAMSPGLGPKSASKLS